MTSAGRTERIQDLADGVRARDRRAISRALSLVEDGVPEGRVLLDRLYGESPQPAHRIGVTGPPGSGKSTLTSELVRSIRSRDRRVGVLAVDPSSPFTGGAILGDRIRMQVHVGDPGVFIRSMASRGSLGGLASTTYEASEVLEAAGYDWILIETVGVGQSEMEIIEAADTTVLVLVPGSGDSIQAMKAGLMEAADVFVINKCDREGADRLRREITLVLELARERRAADRTRNPGALFWEPPILETVAVRGEGIEPLREAVEAHGTFLRRDPEAWTLRQRERLERRLRTHLRDRLLHRLGETGDIERWVRESRERAEAGEASPVRRIDEMVDGLLGNGKEGER